MERADASYFLENLMRVRKALAPTLAFITRGDGEILLRSVFQRCGDINLAASVKRLARQRHYMCKQQLPLYRNPIKLAA